MLRRLLIISFFLLSYVAKAQLVPSGAVLTSVYVDRCSGEAKVFSIPMNGSTVITFYDQSKVVTAEDFRNGTLQSWLESVYLSWRQVNPCSQNQAENNVLQTTVQQTTQAATQAATQSVASVPIIPQTDASPSIPSTPAPATTPTVEATAVEVQTPSVESTPSVDNTPQPTDTTSSDQPASGGTETTETAASEPTSTTESSEAETSSTDSTETQEDNSSEPEATEDTVEEGSSSESEDDGGDSSDGEASEESEEQVEEETTEEETTEEESTEEESEETTEETEEEDTEEGGKKKKKKKKSNTAPPIIIANVSTMQNIDGTFQQAMTMGISKSSLRGDKSYGLTSMVWSNLKQYMLMGTFSKVFFKEGKPFMVYSAGIGASKMFTTVIGMNNHSLVFLGNKGLVMGGSLGITSIYLNYDIMRKTVIFDDNIISGNFTAFATKPIPLGRVTISPMLAASKQLLNYAVYGEQSPVSKDLMYITGSNFDFSLTKRFKANLGINAINNTNKEIPTTFTITIGSRFTF